VDVRENMTKALQQRFPRVQTTVADCQRRLDFPDGCFDRLIAIHVLEHLPNLPAAVRELYRVCNRQHGTLAMVIPCEGSWATRLARRLTAQRIFEARYGQSYDWFIRREHINLPGEIFSELAPFFELVHRTSFPIPLPFLWCNLFIGATFKPRAHPLPLPRA
jgi:ubiquinone/menaquinone biosynthesis C-methylase UbiE